MPGQLPLPRGVLPRRWCERSCAESSARQAVVREKCVELLTRRGRARPPEVHGEYLAAEKQRDLVARKGLLALRLRVEPEVRPRRQQGKQIAPLRLEARLRLLQISRHAPQGGAIDSHKRAAAPACSMGVTRQLLLARARFPSDQNRILRCAAASVCRTTRATTGSTEMNGRNRSCGPRPRDGAKFANGLGVPGAGRTQSVVACVWRKEPDVRGGIVRRRAQARRSAGPAWRSRNLFEIWRRLASQSVHASAS
jgi:hypothetical protein